MANTITPPQVCAFSGPGTHSQAAYWRARSDFQADRPADREGCECYGTGWSDAEAAEEAAEARAAEAAEAKAEAEAADQELWAAHDRKVAALDRMAKAELGSKRCYTCERPFRNGEKVDRDLYGAIHHAECFPETAQQSQSGYIRVK